MPTDDRYVCNMANEGHLSGEIRVGSKDEYMPDFDIALLTPAQLQSWKNVTYSFSHPTTKNGTPGSRKSTASPAGSGCGT